MNEEMAILRAAEWLETPEAHVALQVAMAKAKALAKSTAVTRKVDRRLLHRRMGPADGSRSWANKRA